MIQFNFKYSLVLICVSLLTTINSHAQDFQFSHFQMAPLYVNPAMTGYIQDGNNRLIVKYRSQWSSVIQDDAYQTMMASYDGGICIGETFLSYGFQMVKDKSGTPEFQINQFLGSMSLHLPFGRGTYLSGGLQAGLLQYQIDQQGLFFEEQFDGFVGFDSSIPNMENFENYNASLFDIGGGVLLYNDDPGWYIGLAMHHTNTRPYFGITASETQDLNEVNIRTVIHGAYPIKISPANRKHYNSYVVFKGLTMIQLPHWQIVGGADLKLSLSRTAAFLQNITFGAAFRLTAKKPNKAFLLDAFILSTAINLSQDLTFAFSYDINLSPLHIVSSYRGGMEFTLMYKFTIKAGNECVNCPKPGVSF